MSERSSLTIVVPTYNGTDLLRECLVSLDSQTFTDFEVLIVDDGSEEDVESFAASEFPDARVVRLSENMGFASAVNAGLRELRTDYVMLLNNDMTLEAECIGKLMRAVEEGPAAMVAPLVLWKDDPETIYSAGDRILRNGRPESIGFRCSREGFEFTEPVFGVSAGAAVYRREVFERAGLLDERFVAYFEDVDLSFRARLAGFEAACVYDAVAYHVGSASQHGKTWWRSRQCYRNHALLVLKNMPLALLVRYSPRLYREHLHQARMLVSSARGEFGLLRALLEWVRAWVEIISLLPHALGARRHRMRTRAISDADLDELLKH